MMHELVLSARLCDWFGDFPYAYYKANTTPGFVSCLDHYVAWSGDRELLEELWPNALAAYRCCLANLEDDGLLSDRKLGMAAVEAGALVGRIRGEVYLQAIWISALRGIERMALVLDQPELARESRENRGRAEAAFEAFWSDENGRFGFAQLTDGTRCDDLTAYQAVAASRGIGSAERALATAAQINRPSLASDWGVRFFSDEASIYAPQDYNTGSVFPYATNFAILAQFRHGLATSGHQLLASQIALHGFSGLGFVPEHLRGDICAAPERGVPHQIFSSACILQSTLFGMLGLQASADDGLLLLSPALPPLGTLFTLENLSCAGRRVTLAVTRRTSRGRTRISFAFRLSGGAPLRVLCRPLLPPLSRDVTETADDAEFPSHGEVSGQATRLEPVGGSLRAQTLAFELRGIATLHLEYASGPQLVLDALPLVEGARSSRLRVCETVHDQRGVEWTLWGRAGRKYALPYRSDRELDFDGALPTAPRELEISFPGDDDGTFVSKRLRATAHD
jgi:hypothetical protein